MHNHTSLFRPFLVRTGASLSVLCSKAFVLAFVCALCLLSTLFLQPAPIAHADALNCTADSSAAKNPVEVCVWLNHRKLHDFNGACSTYPNTDASNTDNTEPKCAVRGYIDKGSYRAECQTQGGTVTDLGYTNNWWTRLEDPSKVILGWISNIYIKGHDNKATNVPECNFGVTVPLNPNPAPSTPPKVYIYRTAPAYSCIYPSSCTNKVNVTKNHYDAYCQQQGEKQYDGKLSNTWWTLIKNGDNKLVWVSNLYIQGGEIIENIPHDKTACHDHAPAGYPDGYPH